MSFIIFFGTNGWLAQAFAWIYLNYIEVFASLLSIVYLIFSIRGNVWLWFFGIISSGLYVYVFYKSGLYADMSINVYYVFVSIYGWLHWLIFKHSHHKTIPYSRVTKKEVSIIIIITLIIFGILFYILKYFTDSTVPIFDSFLTACSITATFMLARKIIEHWLIWIFVDFLSIGLFIYKGLYPTTVLFFIYGIFAIMGFIEWKKQWQIQAAN